MTQMPRGTDAGWKSRIANTTKAAITATVPPRSTPHMSCVETYRHQRL